MPISFDQYKGVKYMFADYKGVLKEQDQLTLLEEVGVEISKFTPAIPLLVDYNGVTSGVEYMSRLKVLGNTVFKKHMKCSAVLGITGLKKILFNGYNTATGAKNVKAFNTQEEALEWLVTYKS
jgi:hypothetical protein